MSSNGFSVVRIGNGSKTHAAGSFDIENGYARCGCESRVDRGRGGRRPVVVLEAHGEASADNVSCSKCREMLARYNATEPVVVRREKVAAGCYRFTTGKPDSRRWYAERVGRMWHVNSVGFDGRKPGGRQFATLARAAEYITGVEEFIANAEAELDVANAELVVVDREAEPVVVDAAAELEAQLVGAGAVYHRVAGWGEGVARVERKTRGHDGRYLSTGDYLTDIEPVGVVEAVVAMLNTAALEQLAAASRS